MRGACGESGGQDGEEGVAVRGLTQGEYDILRRACGPILLVPLSPDEDAIRRRLEHRGLTILAITADTHGLRRVFPTALGREALRIHEAITQTGIAV